MPVRYHREEMRSTIGRWTSGILAHRFFHRPLWATPSRSPTSEPASHRLALLRVASSAIAIKRAADPQANCTLVACGLDCEAAAVSSWMTSEANPSPAEACGEQATGEPPDERGPRWLFWAIAADREQRPIRSQPRRLLRLTSAFAEAASQHLGLPQACASPRCKKLQPSRSSCTNLHCKKLQSLAAGIAATVAPWAATLHAHSCPPQRAFTQRRLFGLRPSDRASSRCDKATRMARASHRVDGARPARAELASLSVSVRTSWRATERWIACLTEGSTASLTQCRTGQWAGPPKSASAAGAPPLPRLHGLAYMSPYRFTLMSSVDRSRHVPLRFVIPWMLSPPLGCSAGRCSARKALSPYVQPAAGY